MISPLMLPVALQTAEPSWSHARTPEPPNISVFVPNQPALADFNTLKYERPGKSPIGIDAEPTEKEKIEGRITSYLLLENDWDGYEGKPPSNQAVVDSLMWLSLLPTDTPLPKPMLSGAGEVGLYWEAADFYCDIGFFGDGTFSFYAERPDGSSMSNEDIEIKSTPESLLILLLKIGEV